MTGRNLEKYVLGLVMREILKETGYDDVDGIRLAQSRVPWAVLISWLAFGVHKIKFLTS